MNDIVSLSKLNFFKTEKNKHNNTHIFDVSNIPRPHYCMGLIKKGTAVFKDYTDTENNHEEIKLNPGDIIFVPVSSKYISVWNGNPDIEYTSFHFTFDFPSVFSREGNFKLQKISSGLVENANEIFDYALFNFNKDYSMQLSVLSMFYSLLGSILPILKTRKKKHIDTRIVNSIKYIEQNYFRNISIETLANASNMSVSRFFPCFKKSLGMTPTDYLNRYRIDRAILLLKSNEKVAIEEISGQTGFNSSAYFRRTFKKMTGKTPAEYRKTAMEI